MSPEILSIIVLVLLFVIATTMPVNLGALALARRVLCRHHWLSGFPSTRSSSASPATAR